MSNEVEGLKALSDKLAAMSGPNFKKNLRSAISRASTPTFKAMKNKVPVRKAGGPKRTYKGRLVAPGFLSRSVIRQTRVRNGKVVVIMGVKKEAYYGPGFVDQGVTVTKRKGRPIKPYTIKPANWFFKTFRDRQGLMINDVKSIMGKIITRIAKRGR